MNIPERLQALRSVMAARKIDAYIIPTADFHQSEYVGEHFKSRAFITGFTGSAGTALVTMDRAYLWTDGRYFIQAAQELEGTTVELMKQGEPDVPTLAQFLEQNLPQNAVLGFDGRSVAMQEGKVYEKIVQAKNGSVHYHEDLVDKVWSDRPALSTEPVFALGVEYAGETTASKLERIRKVMAEKNAASHILTTLDDICWTLNIRGNDIEFFPLVLSYAIITMDEMLLYIDENKLSDEIKQSFAQDNIKLLPYDQIYSDAKNLTGTTLIDPLRINFALYNNLPESVQKIEAESPEILFKSIKNDVELENIRNAQIKDAVAHVRFMKWLKENIGKIEITELSATAKLLEYREAMGNFVRQSFAPISSVGAHGAIVHYSATQESNATLYEGTLYLSDTGAGFMEGSTDITRTFALGEIPRAMKEHFSIVAASNLLLGSAKFLQGVNGANLDILARKAFWDRGLNYNHGTGHGVGYLLNIHEGPTSMRWQTQPMSLVAFQEGMIITNEPGIYIEGSHGIRLENELLVRKGEKNEYGQFLYFETITWIPFDLDAIAEDFLNAEEKKLLNEYHAKVYENIAPHLNDDEKEFLKKYTRAI